MNIIAFFSLYGTPQTGLSPTVRIRIVSTNALVVTDAAMTEVGDGFYKYSFSEFDKTVEYSIRCDGGATLAGAERYPVAITSGYGEVLSVKEQTDKITFTTANQVDARVRSQDNIDFGALQKASLSAATPTVTVGDKTGFELAADQAVNVTKIAGAAVSTSTAQIGVNVVSQDNIDFGALQKASITAAVPDVSAIQSGLALDATVAKAATALSTAVWTNAKAAFLDVAVSSLGTGITSFPAQTYTITIDGVPCADCLVVMTTDIAGSNPIHSGTTNALGQVTFYPNLPAGTTVYLWRFKTGVNFVNPDTEAIS
jgi:hypothetical protein